MLVRSVIYRKNGWGFNFIRPFQKEKQTFVVCFFFLLLPIADEEPRKSQKCAAGG